MTREEKEQEEIRLKKAKMLDHHRPTWTYIEPLKSMKIGVASLRSTFTSNNASGESATVAAARSSKETHATRSSKKTNATKSSKKTHTTRSSKKTNRTKKSRSISL